MRVGIEVMAAVLGRRTGVGQYTDELVRGMAQQAGSEFEFIYYANKYAPVVDQYGPYLKASDLYPRFQFRQYMMWLHGWLPWAIRASKPDLVHFANYLAPLAPIKPPFILTIYDMTAFTNTEQHSSKTVFFLRNTVPRVAPRARLITTLSHSAAHDIETILKVSAEKIRVIYCGVSPMFHTAPTAETTQAVVKKYGLNFPYILAVGTLEPRKNLVRLVEAYSQLVKQERLPHHLVMVGGSGWKDQPIGQTVEQEGLSDRIHFLGYVPREDLPVLYRQAQVFAFPSLKEGFGLPVVEAMASGTPVLTSTDAALVEVSGGAAVTVDPLSVADIAGGLHKLLTDKGQAETLRAAGLERAKLFDWQETARQTLQAYRDAINLR